MNIAESVAGPLSRGMQDAPGTDAFLRANDAAYRWLVEKALRAHRRGELDAALRHVVAAAGFATDFHAGRFADGTIENIALEIGRMEDGRRSLDTLAAPGRAGRASRRRVLHVASQVAGIGGHSRMLYRWACRDRSSSHALVLTAQGGQEVPSWLRTALGWSGGGLLSLPAALGPREQALCLREAVRRHADLVVLHHNGNDVVPTLALAVDDVPPVVVLNHADHQFWLGSAVADAAVNLRSKACGHTLSRRFIRHNLVLPVPLDQADPAAARQPARSALGLPPDQVVLLSIGRGIKYRPSGAFDFVATAGRILDRLPRAHLYVVGESAAGIQPHLRTPIHERLHFVGPVEDPSLFRAAADVYLESFPFGSQTALLESALLGLPVVRAYAPLFELLVAQDDAIEDLLPTPASEQAYVERVVALAGDPVLRESLGRELRRRLVQAHVGAGWTACLEAVYRATDRLRHAPRPVPACGCGDAPADVCLSRWHALPDGRQAAAPTACQAAAAAALHGACVSWRVRNMAACRRHAWQAAWRRPLAGASWRVLGIALLGRQIDWVRRRLRRG